MEHDKWYNKSDLEIAQESVNGFEAESRCMKGSDRRQALWQCDETEARGMKGSLKSRQPCLRGIEGFSMTPPATRKSR